MYIRTCAAVLGTVLAFAGEAIAGGAHLEKRDLNSFVRSEKAVALDGILANLGPDGALDHNASAGVVIASPSTVYPNYLYTWTRDSALTLKTLVDEFIGGNQALQSHIDDYITAQAILQTVSNPSGSLSTGQGLGEPKYYVNITRFNGAWGRPQRDGPALRAITLMNYINYLAKSTQFNAAVTTVWPIVINDLNYVGQYWNQTGFDLWEEVSGSSFFTIQNQWRALVQGSQVAKTLNQTCDSCDSQAPEVLCFLQSFWNGQYVVSNINTETERSGHDTNSILGPIAIFDLDGDCNGADFQPCNSKTLSNLKGLTDSFRGIYAINSGVKNGSAVAIGRYPEDIYYEGNPWFLCTLAVAELLYDAIGQWEVQASLTIDSLSLPFFQDIYPDATSGTFQAGSSGSTFDSIVSAVSTYADGFVSIVQTYLPANNSISEQYSRENGTSLSAYDLTWSFASFVTMAERRAGYFPAPWGSRSGAPAPSTCSGTSAVGTYAPATAAGAPNASDSCTVNVLFRVNATTYFGENIYMFGNDSALGNFNVANADALNPGNYTSERPLWYLYIDLPADETVSYNYVRQEGDGSFLYETVNRTFAVPECGTPQGTAAQEDAWTGPTGTTSSGSSSSGSAFGTASAGASSSATR
ncbi:hypothetical protein MMC25_007403 [Agyrium rufum]|nr:hypothetical protein [Agyrium rufum]